MGLAARIQVAKVVHRGHWSLYGVSDRKGGAMHISLTDKLDEYVRAKVASGLYDSASDVIREALRLKIEADMVRPWLG